MKYAINFFLISAVLGVAVSFQKIYLFHVSLVILILTVFLNFPKVRRLAKVPYGNHLFMVFMLSWYLISLIWARNFKYGFKYLFFISCGAVIIFAITYYSTNLKKQNQVFLVLGVMFILEICLSLAEQFTMFRLPISPLSEFSILVGRTPWKVTLEQKKLLHIPTGFHWNPNNLAVVMNIVLPFLLFYPKKIVKIIGGLSVLVIILGTESRGAFIGYLIIIFLWFFKTFNFKKRYLLLGLAIGISVFSSYYIQEKNSFYILSDTFEVSPEQNDSLAIRKYLIVTALSAFKDNFILGLGAGSLSSLLETPQVAFFQMVKFGMHITTLHNFWIELLVESGILFFCLFLVWYCRLIYKQFSVAKQSKSMRLTYFSTSSGIALIGFAFSVVSCSTAIYLLPFWILIGFSCANINNYFYEKELG